MGKGWHMMFNYGMAIKFIYPILFIMFVIFAIVGLLLNYKFLGYLREKHIEKWKELGKPTLFINNSVQNNIKTLRFLKNREYLDLNDNLLNQKAKFLWNYNCLYLGFFVTLIALFFIKLIK